MFASLKRDCPRTACAIFAWPLRSALGWRAVFSGSDAEGWKYAVAGQEDVRPLGKALNQAFAGRGGGKAALVQGSVQGTREAIESFVLHTAI